MKSESAAALADHLGYWLRYVSNHVSQGFARRLESRGVTVAEWVILRELFDVEAMVPSQLAEKLGLTRGAISKLADRLAAKALIIRTASTEDRRSQTLALTPAGRNLVPALAGLADENDADFFGHLTAEQRAGIAAVLQDIVHRRGLKAAPLD
jgi:DNA-binding MarR family transcriptional regulator